MMDFIQNTDGQVAIGNADGNHIKSLLAFCKGWQKFFPFVGACLPEDINNERAPVALKNKIRAELTQDGCIVTRLDAVAQPQDASDLQIDAHYG